MLCICICYSQNPNYVYSNTNTTAKRIPLPSNREVHGGTIIKPIYLGTGFSEEKKGALEYAIKIIEEVIPTTCPINIQFEFGNLQNNVLAMVQSMPALEGMCDMDKTVDKVYAKRYVQLANPNNSFESDIDGLEFYKYSLDATIKFSNSRNLFSYNLDPSSLPATKYDFITVALQALIKAMGFTCKAHLEENGLCVSEPTNIYTCCILRGDSVENYRYATSDNVYIGTISDENLWKLESGQPYREGISLNYFERSSNNESAIMEYGISKGSYIRHIGNSIRDFFSFCGWDRDLATGNSISINNATTNSIIAFRGIRNRSQNLQDCSPNMRKSNENESLHSYLSSVSEVKASDGDYVLMKNGTWESYTSLLNLTDTNNYARSPEGHLRLKKIRTSHGVGNWYSNKNITYELYSYLPQKPEVSMLRYTELNDDDYLLRLARQSHANINEDEDIFLEVEIAFKNTEGSNWILVEQTDSDYPVPYSFFVDDPKSGSFTTYMNKAYTSDFRLTYINQNGETVGNTFTIDLRDQSSESNFYNRDLFNILSIEQNHISYSIENKQCKMYYKISDIYTRKCILEDEITHDSGSINISMLPNGMYVLNIYNDENKKIAEYKWVKR